MKISIKSFILMGLFLLLIGCDIVDKAKRQIHEIIYQYEENQYNKNRGEKPFEVEYQKDPSKKTRIISAQCGNNKSTKYVYYDTPQNAHSTYNHDIKYFASYPTQGTLIPFWDIRYVNPVTKYIDSGNQPEYADHSKYTGLDIRSGNKNIGIGTSASKTDASGSIAQSKCVDGTLAGGTTLNLYDAPNQSLDYGGPHTSFKYSFESTAGIRPWKANKTGNLMIQSYFNTPLYISHTKNIGGGVSFGLFLYNKRNGKHLNYVIGIFAAGEAWIREKAGIRYDPTTNVVHVATVIKESSWWSTISLDSNTIEQIFKTSDKDTRKTKNWNNFYRVNISYQNLFAVLTALKDNPPADVVGEDFGLNPEDWELSSIMIQYELDEIGGEAILSGSFKGFEVYLSQLPL